MARYALIDQSNVVENVTEFDGVAPSTWNGLTVVQSDVAQVGGTYDPATGAFSAPVPKVDPLADDVQRCRNYVISTTPGDLADQLSTYLSTASPTAADTVQALKVTIRTLRSLIRIVRRDEMVGIQTAEPAPTPKKRRRRVPAR